MLESVIKKNTDSVDRLVDAIIGLTQVIHGTTIPAEAIESLAAVIPPVEMAAPLESAVDVTPAQPTPAATPAPVAAAQVTQPAAAPVAAVVPSEPAPAAPVSGEVDPILSQLVIEVTQVTGNPMAGMQLMAKHGVANMALATPEQNAAMIAELQALIASYGNVPAV